MKKSVEDIHQQVFDILIKYHKNDPNNFFFGMRQINRSARLDKGYWFFGDETYLAVSFWRGRDWMSRLPRISFFLLFDGRIGLELSCKDTDDDIFQIEFLDKLGFTRQQYNQGYRKLYSSSLNDLAKELENFIKGDKQIIDDAIWDDECLKPGEWMEYADAVEFIRKEDFERNLAKIRLYQDSRKQKQSEGGYLKSVEIHKYCGLESVSIKDIPISNRWIFLTGENGAGKSSVLKAIALALCRNTDEKEPIEATEEFAVDITINQGTHDDTFKITTNSFDVDAKWIPKGFAAYGPIRLLTKGSLDPSIFKEDISVQTKVTYGLFNPIGVLKDLDNDYPLHVKPKYMELSINDLIDNLMYIIPNISYIKYNQGKLIYFENGFDEEGSKIQGLPFNKLPSGTRNYASLILDLLIRFQKQQPDVNDIANYRGIVIIDEIDLHLHPKLQIELVKQLSDTFPKLQFIVSTHSPIPLMGAPENSVFVKVTKSKEEGIKLIRLEKLEKEIKHLLPNTILTSSIFDFDYLEQIKDEEFDDLYLEDNYNEIEENRILNEKLKNLDMDIFPDDLFDKNSGTNGTQE